MNLASVRLVCDISSATQLLTGDRVGTSHDVYCACRVQVFYFSDFSVPSTARGRLRIMLVGKGRLKMLIRLIEKKKKETNKHPRFSALEFIQLLFRCVN